MAGIGSAGVPVYYGAPTRRNHPFTSASAAETACGWVDCGVLRARTDASGVTTLLHGFVEERAVPLPFGKRQRAEIPAFREQLPHHPSNHLVGLPERHPLADEEVGDVGREQQARRGGGGLRREHLEAVDDADERGQRARRRVSSASNTASLSSCRSLLYPLGSPFIVAIQPVRWPIESAGLAADQLERIGILLLRHHAAAGARRIGELKKPVLLAAEDDEIFGQPAQMHHAQGARMQERRQRSRDPTMRRCCWRRHAENPSRDASLAVSIA